MTTTWVDVWKAMILSGKLINRSQELIFRLCIFYLPVRMIFSQHCCTFPNTTVVFTRYPRHEFFWLPKLEYCHELWVASEKHFAYFAHSASGCPLFAGFSGIESGIIYFHATVSFGFPEILKFHTKISKHWIVLFKWL